MRRRFTAGEMVDLATDPSEDSVPISLAGDRLQTPNPTRARVVVGGLAETTDGRGYLVRLEDGPLIGTRVYCDARFICPPRSFISPRGPR